MKSNPKDWTIERVFGVLYFIVFILGSGSGQAQVVAEEEVVHALSSYIQHPSTSGSEREAGLFFRDLCIEKGLYVTQLGTEDGHFNFVASLYPLRIRKPNVLFLNHIDVVEADTVESKWTHPPFAGEIADGQVWGRGAFDNKGLAIMQLYAIAAFAEQARLEDLPFNVSLLSVSCEETQCGGGASYVADHFLDTLQAVVLFGEGPPSLGGLVPSHPEQLIFAIALGHKRACWIKLHTEVPSIAHGSVTPLQYSSREMVRVLDRVVTWKSKMQFNDLNRQMLRDLGRLEGGVAGFFLRHPRLAKPLLVPVLRREPALSALFTDNITLTGIHAGGHSINNIPQECSALLDCRLLPESDQAEFLNRLKRRIKSDEVQVEVVMDMPEGQPSSMDNPFYEMMYHAISDHYPEAEVIPALIPNFNDDGWFRAKGVPCYSSIPIKIPREVLEKVHGIDEHIPIQALQEGVAVYTDLIRRIQERK